LGYGGIILFTDPSETIVFAEAIEGSFEACGGRFFPRLTWGFTLTVKEGTLFYSLSSSFFRILVSWSFIKA